MPVSHLVHPMGKGHSLKCVKDVIKHDINSQALQDFEGKCGPFGIP
jgi:hypothetical protein